MVAVGDRGQDTTTAAGLSAVALARMGSAATALWWGPCALPRSPIVDGIPSTRPAGRPARPVFRPRLRAPLPNHAISRRPALGTRLALAGPAVSAPRMLLPGSSYLVTRRCSERRFFLLPSELTNQIVLYCLALAAERTGVQVHAFCVLSNHYHLVVSDPDARLPECMQWMNSLIARALNASRGRWENLFEAGSASYSAVRLESRETLLEKLVYTLANPVSSGLVRHAHTWPGLWSRPRHMMAEPLVAVRPRQFFRDEDSGGLMPLVASLPLARPPGFDDLSDDDLRELITGRLLERGTELAATAAVEGRAFLGVKGVLAQRYTDSPTTREPRRKLDPRVAERDPGLRIAALRRLVDFLLHYRAAWLRFVAGDRAVVFPAGTYALRRRFHVTCADTG